eukprot:1968772-Pleurochrysis_carterae.AAC.1
MPVCMSSARTPTWPVIRVPYYFSSGKGAQRAVTIACMAANDAPSHSRTFVRPTCEHVNELALTWTSAQSHAHVPRLIAHATRL